jgi:hypothetical protein
LAEIFISFIHEEVEYADAVQGFLLQVTHGEIPRPFLSADQLQVYAGEKWLERIIDELETSKTRTPDVERRVSEKTLG